MKYFLSCLMMLCCLSPNVTFAENKQCRVIDDLLKETGYSYNGNCVNGLADGNGTVSGTAIDNQRYSYKGQFKKGYIEGQGFSVYLGHIYSGNFRKGKLDGSCQMIFAEGSTYTGNCSMNRPHGYGDLKLKTGSIEMYVGNFVQGKKSGKGKTVFRDGSYYEGEYANDLPEGHGKYFFHRSGIIYIGQFHKGLRHGSGTESHPIGVTYQGQLKNDLRHGKGVMIITGKKYSGVWENDKAVSGDILKIYSPTTKNTVTYTPQTRIPYTPLYRSNTCEDGHWIKSVVDHGSIIILEDSSIWEVDALDKINSALWLPVSKIVACPERLINTDDNQVVSARRIK